MPSLAICVCSSKLQGLNKNILMHMNLYYVRSSCRVNHRSELSIFCEIFKSHCFIFYRITSDVGQTAGNNNLNYMSICLLPLHVWNKIHLVISRKDHIFWIPSTKMGLIWERFHTLCFVDCASLYNLFQMKPTRCTLLLSTFSSTSLHVSGNYVPIIRRTYCIYVTLVLFTLYRWLSSVA